MMVEQLCEVLENPTEDYGDQQLKTYEELLNKLLDECERGNHEIVCVSRMVIVCAGHSGSHYWTDSTTRQLAKDILIGLTTNCGYTDFQDFLMGEKCLLANVLDYLKAILTKDKWKLFPLQKQALIWIIKCIKHPNLAPWLSYILPPTLWMLEDYLDYHKIQALSIITHIILQMDPTELRWGGRAELLYQAMKPLLYVNSAEVAYALHSCLLHLLPVLDYSASPPSIPAKPTTTDEVFAVLINVLIKESKVPLQRAYVAQLKGYIHELGIFTTRHVKQLLPLLLSKLDCSDPALSKLCLQSISALVSVTWPRTSTYQFTIIKSLSQLVQTLQDPGVLGAVVECLVVLMAACPDLKGDYEQLEKSCNHSIMQQCLQQALQH